MHGTWLDVKTQLVNDKYATKILVENTDMDKLYYLVSEALKKTIFLLINEKLHNILKLFSLFLLIDAELSYLTLDYIFMEAHGGRIYLLDFFLEF